MATHDSLTVSAVLVESMGSISRYQVTATLIVVAEAPSQAVAAVVEALGDLT